MQGDVGLDIGLIARRIVDFLLEGIDYLYSYVSTTAGFLGDGEHG